MLLALAWAGPARAAPPLVRIDRIEVEPSVFDGLTRLQVFATAVDLHGVFRDDLTGERDWKLRIGNRPLRAPFLLGTFRNVDDELLVAVVVETAAPFGDALPEIRTQLEAFLQTLPPDTRVLVLGYDDDVKQSRGGRRPVEIARVRQAISDLDVNATSTEFKLIEAVDDAREVLARTRPETPGVGQRKMIVVISDGKDVDPSPANYRAVSKRAGTQGIRIHTLAFPADRNRHPLYGLAEMSKQSGGTFRLVLTKSGFAGHFEQLAREINDQYVLTYFVPEDQIARKRIQLEARDVVSESARVPRTTCGGESCAAGEFCAAMRCVAPPQPEGLGVMGWLGVIAGVVVGLLIAVGLLGVLLGWLQRRRERQAGGEAGPEAGAEAGAQAGAGAGAPEEPAVQRVIPQGPDGQPVQHAHAQAQGMAGTGKHAPVAGTGKHAPVAGTGKHAPVAGTGKHAPVPGHTGAHPSAAPAPGTVQRVLPSGPSAAMPAMGAAAPSLLVLTGIHAGKRVPLHHGFVIGTAPGSHLMISDDRFASSHHAHVLMDAAGGCTLVDRASTNGTFINGVRMREQRLVHGMLIKIGSTEARFLSQ